VSGFSSLELQGGGARVTLAPAFGGRIIGMEMAGRQWLWTNPDFEYRPITDGASYAEAADAGGYDDCFPTFAACVLPSGTAGYGSVTLPDHGELWSQRPTVRFDLDAEGQRATCEWVGQRLPYTFSRTVQVTGGGEIRMQYRIENRGTHPLPFIWASEPLLPLSEDTQIDLPTGSIIRVAHTHGAAVRGMAQEGRWPNVRLATRIADLTVPAALARRYACKLFVDLPAARVVVGVTEGPRRLDVRVDGREVSHIGLWLNNGEWVALPRAHAPRNLTFAPCIGASDQLTTALTGWRTAQWVAPGADRRWTVTWSARRLDAAAA
jgi:hypothetical protein